MVKFIFTHCFKTVCNKLDFFQIVGLKQCRVCTIQNVIEIVAQVSLFKSLSVAMFMYYS